MRKESLGRTVLAVLFVSLVSHAAAQSPNRKSNPECCSIVINALEAVSHIRTGMSRAEVEKVFVVDGGLISKEKTRYSFRDCRAIKVEITFDLKEVRQDAIGSPKDTVSAFSKPYIEYPNAD